MIADQPVKRISSGVQQTMRHEPQIGDGLFRGLRRMKNRVVERKYRVYKLLPQHPRPRTAGAERSNGATSREICQRRQGAGGKQQRSSRPNEKNHVGKL